MAAACVGMQAARSLGAFCEGWGEGDVLAVAVGTRLHWWRHLRTSWRVAVGTDVMKKAVLEMCAIVAIIAISVSTISKLQLRSSCVCV